jgi:hypothetical protein
MIDHDVARWIFAVLGIAGIAATLLYDKWTARRRATDSIPPPSTKEPMNLRGKGRTVTEKHRARAAWESCIDGLLSEGQQANTAAQRRAWRDRALAAFDDYLRDPAPHKAKLAEIAADIDARGEKGEKCARRVSDYLASLRKTLTEREIR